MQRSVDNTAPRRSAEWLIPILLGVLAAASVGAVWSRHTGGWMDTLHYVEAAEGLARGGLPWISSPFYVTRFLFLDGGRTLTEWPLLFPALIAAMIRLGVDGVTAARLISVAAFAAIPIALWALARPYLSIRKAAAAAVLTLCAGGMFHHATAGMSETLSVALTLAGAACALRFGDSLSGSPSRAAAYGAWLFLGAACATRYAGAFALPGLCAWLLWRGLGAGKIRWVAVWSAGMGVIALFPMLFKRYASVYSVFDRGPLSDIPTNVVLSIRDAVQDMFLGSHAVPFGAALAVLAAAAVLIALKAHRTPPAAVRDWLGSAGALCVAASGSYVVLLIWTASHRTIDPVNTRYMLPVYPFLFVAIAGAVSAGLRPLALVALIAGAGIWGDWHTVTHELITDDFIFPPQTIAWLKTNVAPNDVILSTDWHFARWLGRPVYDLPVWNWAGYTFSPADALLATHAGRKVFVVMRRRDIHDALLGKHGEYGVYLKELVETGRAPFARTVADLPEDVVYSFDAAWGDPESSEKSPA